MWTSGEPQGGYLDAELLDGRRGLVPASFVQRLVGKWIGFASILYEVLSMLTASEPLLLFARRRPPGVPPGGAVDAARRRGRVDAVRHHFAALLAAAQPIAHTHPRGPGTFE